MSISPHGTKLIELKELLSTSSFVGGIRIQHDGPDSAMVVSGGLEDISQGYSATILFSHAPPAADLREATIAELGLMTGTADPMMRFPADTVFTPYSLVRNISDEPVTASPTLYWMEGATAHAVPLPQLTLAPHRTQNLDAPSLLSRSGLKNYNGSFDLVFEVAQNSRALLMLSGSVDAKNTYVFEVLPRAADKSIGKSLGYWSTANGDDTMVTLWNPADEEQDLQFTLFFSGGHYKLPLHLGPRATRGFNISEIVQNQIPDADGNIIPPTVHEGSAEITGTLSVAQHILVGMDAATYNVRKATCNWGCTTCDNAVDFAVVADPFSLAVGGQTQLTGTMQLKDGTKHTGGTWSSSNTAVATVSSGLTKAKSVGSVTIIDNFGDYPLLSQQCGGPPPTSCTNQPIMASSDGDVGCTFTIAPASATANDCTNGTLNTLNFIATPYPSSCSFNPSTSTCTTPTTATGAIDLVHAQSPECSTTYQPTATIEYYAGPPGKNKSAGTITQGFTLDFNGDYVTKSQTAQIQCP